MGYHGKLEEKIRAQELRRQGLSYQEILTHVRVSKGILSQWCKDILLSDQQKEKLLQNKSFGQKKGSIIAAENKRQARIKRTKEVYVQAKKEIGSISSRDTFMLGAALYAAEGDKTDRKGGFTNADARLIRFMMNWFLDHCHVPIEKIRGAIWIHEGLDVDIAKRYWSDLTGIPLDQFHKTYIVENKGVSKKIRKNIHEYGIFAIRFSNSLIHRRIMGWISALFGDKMI